MFIIVTAFISFFFAIFLIIFGAFALFRGQVPYFKRFNEQEYRMGDKGIRLVGLGFILSATTLLIGIFYPFIFNSYSTPWIKTITTSLQLGAGIGMLFLLSFRKAS